MKHQLARRTLGEENSVAEGAPKTLDSLIGRVRGKLRPATHSGAPPGSPPPGGDGV